MWGGGMGGDSHDHQRRVLAVLLHQLVQSQVAVGLVLVGQQLAVRHGDLVWGGGVSELAAEAPRSDAEVTPGSQGPTDTARAGKHGTY